MWSPTHVQVVVHRARNLTVKGKHGTNDAFVTIQLGKEKYQTSVKEKSSNPEWNEECELTIPDGNTSCITLTALHRNFVGLDKFLGQISIPLNELFTTIYERSKSRWYQLEGKSKKVNTKERGELEVRIAFTVKSVAGSLVDLSKKERKSNSLPLKMVQTVGGSLMNLAGKDKKLGSHLPFKTLANYGHKLSDKFPKRKSSKNKDEFGIHDRDFSAQNTPERGSTCDSDDEQYVFGLDPLTDDQPTDFEPDIERESPIHEQPEIVQAAIEKDKRRPERRRTIPSLPQLTEENEEISPKWKRRLRKMKVARNNSRRHTIDSVVLEQMCDDIFEESSNKADVAITSPPPIPPSPTNQVVTSKSSALATTCVSARGNSVPSLPPRKQSLTSTLAQPVIKSDKPDVIQDGDKKLFVGKSKLLSALPKEKLSMFEKMSREDLVELVLCQQTSIDRHLKQIRDLEDYIDDLLVRVMETTPRLLQNPFKLSPSMRNDGFYGADAKNTLMASCHYL